MWIIFALLLTAGLVFPFFRVIDYVILIKGKGSYWIDSSCSGLIFRGKVFFNQIMSHWIIAWISLLLLKKQHISAVSVWRQNSCSCSSDLTVHLCSQNTHTYTHIVRTEWWKDMSIHLIHRIWKLSHSVFTDFADHPEVFRTCGFDLAWWCKQTSSTAVVERSTISWRSAALWNAEAYFVRLTLSTTLFCCQRHFRLF